PHDWKAHLTRRVATVTDQAPLEGIGQGGWRLAYAETLSDYQQVLQGVRKRIDLSSSVGLRLSSEGAVLDVIRGKAADRAGVGPGMKLVAVNGGRFAAERLTEAMAATKGGGTLELLMENGDFFRTHVLNYHDGARYARLEQIADKPDLLGRILEARATPGK